MSRQLPHTLAIFQKRIDGDDALLELARLRFKDAGLGPEFYAGSVEELSWLLNFRPWPEAPATVHLARDIDLFSPSGRSQVLDFAGRFGSRIFGFVVHDQAEIPAQREAYLAALGEINRELLAMPDRPLLFIEYAVGLEPDFFCGLMESVRDLAQVSACLDVGHLGIRQIRADYRTRDPDRDVCAWRLDDPELPPRMADIAASVATALPVVLKTIKQLGRLGKPLHLHLHDGHPLSTFSPFGVADHLGFEQEIPIPFSYQGQTSLATMFGPQGLAAIVNASLVAVPPQLLSLSLEIHPTGERDPLAEWRTRLFPHWTDTTNAELQNNWLSILERNHELVRDFLGRFS